jgi:hypothetical protein
MTICDVAATSRLRAAMIGHDRLLGIGWVDPTLWPNSQTLRLEWPCLTDRQNRKTRRA